MIGEQVPGIARLACEYIFNQISTMEENYVVYGAYLEVYNEIINDLLKTDSINLQLREDPVEGCIVVGARKIVARSANALIGILNDGEK